MLVVPFLVTAIRWRNLMRPQGIEMPLGKCLQLTFVGQFWSIIMPGITGGDLVKIIYAARLTGSKSKAFITIILDRVIGLVALMAIAGTSAGVQLLLNWRAGAPCDNTLLNVFVMIVVMLAALAAGATVYFSRRLRRVSGIEWFVEHLGSAAEEAAEGRAKLEQLFRAANIAALGLAMLLAGVLVLLRFGIHAVWAEKNSPLVFGGIGAMALVALAALGGLALHKRLVARARPLMGKVALGIVSLDETLHVYRGHFGVVFGAFVISVISQLTLPLSAWLSGTALGMIAPPTHYLAYVPLAVLAASLPISLPQGLGFLEWVLDHFFVGRGTATASQAFALTQAVRFLPLLWNLCGAYWVVTGKYSRKEAE
jgi:glycosyltransferase 2 family protein